MVKIGFIVEGDSEAILIKSDSFQSYLKSLNLYCESDLVINAKGKYNLYHPSGDVSKLKTRVLGWLKTLEDKGAEKNFILLDMDNSDPCYTIFKSKVCSRPIDIIIVAKQELEAWYLAETKALRKFLQVDIDEITDPENYLEPLEEIKKLRLLHQKRGVSDKKILTKNMLANGFSLESASLHPNCPSAKYFRDKLLEVATQ
jgi:hypothetical protein